MRILWKLGRGFVKEIVAEMPDPKPPYTSVSTLVRKLQDKGVIGHEEFGKTHRYYPILTEDQYKSSSFSKLFSHYFNGSVEGMVSFFLKEKKASVEELEAILKEIKKKEEQ